MNHKRMMDARLRRDLNERKSLLRNPNDREKLTLKEKRSSGSKQGHQTAVCIIKFSVYGFSLLL